MQSAVDLLRTLQPDKLPPASGKLKRDVSMEEIIQLADEFQQSFDRQGNRLEPVKSALDMHREKFTLRLELSAEEKNRRQEEAWALLDRCRSPLSDSGKFK
ncbi:Ankyrin repeat domaincontaining protein 27like, partial [Caligus rogercresseyi]